MQLKGFGHHDSLIIHDICRNAVLMVLVDITVEEGMAVAAIGVVEVVGQPILELEELD